MSKILNKFRKKYTLHRYNQVVKEFYLNEAKLEQNYTGLSAWFFRLGALGFLFAYTWINTTNIFLSGMFGLSGLLIVHLIIRYLREQDFNSKKEQKRYYLARKKVIENILKQQPQWFPGYLFENLKVIEGFSDVRLNPDISQEPDIPILAKYKGEDIGIGCNHDEENLVESRKIKRFFGALVRRGYNKGFYISTTDYREEAKNFSRNIKSQCNIKLIDQEGIIEVVKLAKIWPSEKEVDELVNLEVDKLLNSKRNARKDVISSSKAMDYVFYGAVLIGFTMLFDTQFKYLYYFCAGILLIMATVSFLPHIKKDNNKHNTKIFE